MGSDSPALFVCTQAKTVADSTLEHELERRVEELGFEFVELETAGDRARPILRLRIDRPDSEPGRGVTLDECSSVSRALEGYLDDLPELSDTYVLEVSSPGLERPLTRARHFQRFVGREIRVKTQGKRLEGALLGVEGDAGEERVLVRRSDGAELAIPLAEVQKANLIHRWETEPS
ncbi:ribosome maturation factor RimP [soil metagenome]